MIHALQLDPRAAFSRVAAVLGVSEQTIARRYRRLRSEGVMRVVGALDPGRLGESDWVLRVRTRPDTTSRLAEALARRDDVFWVAVGSGGAEVLCSVRSRSRAQRDDLLFQQLPSTSQVLGFTAFVVLHRFDARGVAGLLNIGQVLSDGQLRELTPAPVEPVAAVALTAEDEPLLAALVRDGRASLAQLAAASRLTEGRVARRLAVLVGSGALYFDLDVASALLGLATNANLWLTVAPGRLDAVGAQLGGLAEVRFAAAITGTANLMASVTCRDLDALYEFVTGGIGALDGVTALEVSPVLRRVKQAGSLMDGDRLANAAPPAQSRARVSLGS